MKFAPTIDRTFVWVELRKEIGCDDIEITIPTGDTFDCTLAETKLYLLQLGFPELRREKALDQLWNFYAIKFYNDGNQFRTETLEPPQYPEVVGARPLEDLGWIIESGRVK